MYAYAIFDVKTAATVAILFGLFTVAFFLSAREPHNVRRSRIFFVSEVALGLGILIVTKAEAPFPVTFFILSVQVHQTFSYRASQFWIGSFSVMTALVVFLFMPSLEEGLSLLIFIGGYWFFSAFSLVSLQAEKSRLESLELLAQLQQAHQLLREQSVRDSLTGLFNRRYLEETLERETIRSKRNSEPLSLLMIDIDHFKRLNDTYGHLAGDQVLKSFGEFFQGVCRSDDVVCRFGGEEFIIMLPGMPVTTAAERAALWTEQIAQHRVSWEAVMLQATVSMGVAAIPDHAMAGRELIARADEALYYAKHSGRNQAVLYGALAGGTTVNKRQPGRSPG